MFFAFRKTRLLGRISREWSKPIDVGNLGRKSSPKDQLLEQLIELVIADKKMGEHVHRLGLDREDLSSFYQDLLSGGAGHVVRGHFVAASALAFGPTLEYLAQHKKENRIIGRRAVFRLIKYSENGETGFIGD